MNQKGQSEIGTMIGILIGLIIVFIIFSALVWGPPAPDFDLPADNFCQAWANEKNVTHLNGEFRNPILENSNVSCKYTEDAETFDGGISEGEIKFKSFKISIQEIEQWRYKT